MPTSRLITACNTVPDQPRSRPRCGAIVAVLTGRSSAYTFSAIKPAESVFQVIGAPALAATDLLNMSNRTFGNQFFFTLAIVFVPVFLAFRYFESINVMENLGIMNTIMMALVLSAIPAILICIAWRYLKK